MGDLNCRDGFGVKSAHLGWEKRAAGLPEPSGNGPPSGPWSSTICAVLLCVVVGFLEVELISVYLLLRDTISVHTHSGHLQNNALFFSEFFCFVFIYFCFWGLFEMEYYCVVQTDLEHTEICLILLPES